MITLHFNGSDSYTFPSPDPIVSISETPVKVGGDYYYANANVEIIGEITGSSMGFTQPEVRRMQTALASGYCYLTIDGDDYASVKFKPVSINFADHNPARFVPYTVSLEGYDIQYADDSLVYMVRDTVDTWQLVENNDRTITATHQVSAKNENLSLGSSDGIADALLWVNSKLNGFSGISNFLSGYSDGFLQSKEESIDSINNTYSITETYLLASELTKTTGLSIQYGLERNSGIIQVNTQLIYSKDDSLNVRVNGSLIGGLTGFGYPKLNTGDFLPIDAYNIASQAVERSKTSTESGFYGGMLKRKPANQNYSLNPETNTLNFSFDFSNADSVRTGDVINDYNVSISASKDTNIMTITLNGEVRYDNIFDAFSTDAPETQDRWKKVDAYFSGFAPFAVAYSGYRDFQEAIAEYGTGHINFNPKTETINKDPFNARISYNYQFDDSIDLTSGLFNNPQMTIEKIYTIQAAAIEGSINGGNLIINTYRTLPRLNISFNGNMNTGVDQTEAINYVNQQVYAYVSDYANNLGPEGTAIQEEDSASFKGSGISINNRYIYPSPS